MKLNGTGFAGNVNRAAFNRPIERTVGPFIRPVSRCCSPIKLDRDIGSVEHSIPFPSQVPDLSLNYFVPTSLTGLDNAASTLVATSLC